MHIVSAVNSAAKLLNLNHCKRLEPLFMLGYGYYCSTTVYVYKSAAFVENCTLVFPAIMRSIEYFYNIESDIYLRKRNCKMAVKVKKENIKRSKSITTMLNDTEYNAINKYCKKYKVQNRSKMIRDFVFSAILQTYDRDYPTLWDKQIMADLVVEKR